MDRWQSLSVVCQGGLDLSTDALTQGSLFPGSARMLQNFEPALEGGYKRITGYIKWDSVVVPGTSNNPVLAVKPALGGVFAVRKTNGTNDNALYFSSGSGWGSPLNGSTRPGTVIKARIIEYSITEPVIILTDGINYAAKWDGTTYTLLNDPAGAPTDPKYAEMFLSRLVLAGYTANTSAITISAPNDDEDYDAASGALEINVGDTVVGIRTFRDTLYIFCKNSIFKLTGTSSANFAIVPVAKSIGCVSGDSIQEVGGDLIFLAPDGLRSIAGTDRIGDVELGLLSKKIQPIIRTFVGSFADTAFSSCIVRQKSQYRLFIYDTATVKAEALGILGKLESNPESGDTAFAWATTRGIQPYCAGSTYVGNDEIVVMGDPSNGYVYRMERGNDFDGSSIYHIYQSPQLVFDDAKLRKVLQKATVYAQVDGTAKTYLSCLLDFEGTGILQPAPIELTQDGSLSSYGSALYGTDVYGALTYPVFKRNLLGSGFTAAFQYADTNTNPPIRIDSFIIEYGLKGRR